MGCCKSKKKNQTDDQAFSHVAMQGTPPEETNDQSERTMGHKPVKPKQKNKKKNKSQTRTEQEQKVSFSVSSPIYEAQHELKSSQGQQKIRGTEDLATAQAKEVRPTRDTRTFKTNAYEQVQGVIKPVYEAPPALASGQGKQKKHGTEDLVTAQAREMKPTTDTQKTNGYEQVQGKAEDPYGNTQAQPVPPERKDLQKENKKLRGNLEVQAGKIQAEKEKYDKVIQEKDDELQKLKDDLKKKEEEYQSLKTDSEEEIIFLTAELDKRNKSKDDIARKDKDVAALISQVNELKTKEKEIKQNFEKERKQSEEAQKAKKREFEDLVSHKDLALAKKTEQIRKLVEEKEELLLRLSALAGRRLTDNNPNIADLSDMNRPTKLAEKYSELYDNEWTDAFSYLQTFDEYKQSETKTISALLSMLTTAYRISLKTAEEQLQALGNILNDFRGHKENDQHVADVLKQLKDHRKRVIQPNKKLAEDYRQEVKTANPTLPATSFDSDDLKNYLTKCLQLSWLMVIQDPPIHLQCIGCKKGKPFDKNEYKEYTQAGQFVSFTVWPPLFLEKGGTLLCKGVVQCDKRISTSLPTNPVNVKLQDKRPVSVHMSTKHSLTQLPSVDKKVVGTINSPGERNTETSQTQTYHQTYHITTL